MASNKDKLIAAAQKLVEKGQYEKAVKEYLKVVAEDRDDVRIWLKVGDLYAKLNKNKEATETYQRVAQFYSDAGHYLKAVAVYKQILRIEPRLIDINHRLAEMYKQLGLISDAMQQYEAVAAFFHKEGKPRDALAALKQIVELDPENVASRIKVAELYSKEQMTKEAIAEFAKAAEFLHGNERFEDYLKVAERLLFHQPDNFIVTREVARLYVTKGDPRRALPKLQVCLKADARDVLALGLLGGVFQALDQRDKTVSVLKEVARIHQENGSPLERDAALNRILAIAPEDAEARAALGAPRPRATTPVVPEPLRSRLVAVPPPSQAPLGMPRPQPQRPLPLARVTGPAPTVMAPDHAPMATLIEEVAVDSETGSTGHEEEIAKILSETDVYSKYGLHAKSLEHVQKIFAWAPDHVAAHEKLKTIYLAMQRSLDAVDELLKLAAITHGTERAEAYLREAAEIRPEHPDVLAGLATLDAAASSTNAMQVEAPEGVDDDLADSELLDEIEEVSAVVVLDDVIGEEPPSETIDISDGLDVAIESMEIVDEDPYAEAIAAALAADADGMPSNADDPGLHFGASSPFEQPFEQAMGSDEPTIFGAVEVDAAAPEEPMKQAVGGDEALAQRPMDALRAAVRGGAPAEFSAPISMPAEPPLEDDLEEADFFIQQNLLDDARLLLDGLRRRHPDHPLVAARLRDLEALVHSVAVHPPDEESVFEVSAEPEVSVFSEPLDLPKPFGDSTSEPLPDLPPTSATPVHENFSSLEVEGVPESTAVGQVVDIGRRSVVERGVTQDDFETHYDLGIAYKEMGLIDDAIAEFNIAMRDPAREVGCHMMIGLCCVEKGQMTDAINHFKEGLYAERIQEREQLALYFELGQAYERLTDAREALYYYEKVNKRDPAFRDIELRIQALRDGGAPAGEADEFDPLLSNGEPNLNEARGK